jgi:predicted Fe-S protein YdhL (DUF1289 family)
MTVTAHRLFKAKMSNSVDNTPYSTENAAENAAEPMGSQLHQLPDSPCIGICSTLFDEVCQGCGRTAGEVSNWVFLSDAEKLEVWRRITAEGTSVRFVRGVKG